MFSMLSYFVLSAVLLFKACNADCINLVSQYHGANDRTMAQNITTLLVAVPKAAAQKAITESYPSISLLGPPTLLPIPESYNLDPDKHLVLVSCSLSTGIKQTALRIDPELRGCSVLVPWTSTGQSDTPFNTPLVTYIAGVPSQSGLLNNAYLAAAIPSIVATLAGGIASFIGAFTPDDAAYDYANGGLYSSVDWAAVPNQLSGPGLYPSGVSMQFTTDTQPQYTLAQIKTAANQPFILGPAVNLLGLLGKRTCQRNTFYFNGTQGVVMRKGSVTFGAAGDRPGLFSGTLMQASPDGSGVYNGASGFSGCVQLVGYATVQGEECEAAAKKVAAEGSG